MCQHLCRTLSKEKKQVLRKKTIKPAINILQFGFEREHREIGKWIVNGRGGWESLMSIG